jgi:hypothetical protein
MRSKLIASTLGLIASLIIAQVAKADDDDNRDRGHHFCGVDTFAAHIVLTPTDNASNAVGQLNLQACNKNGTTNSQMQIQTFGLAQGDYTVAATLKSDGSSVNIGTITVGNPHWRGYGHGDDNGQGNDGHHGHAYGHYRSANRLALPGTVDPNNISQITVSDTNNVTDLIGDFVNLTSRSFVLVKDKVTLLPGDVATNATGCASLNILARGTNVTGFLALAACHLPTNTVLNVAFDNQPVGTVTTSTRGTAVLRCLNLGNVTVQSGSQVTVTTTDGGTVATGNF